MIGAFTTFGETFGRVVSLSVCLSNEVSNIVRRHIDNRRKLLVYSVGSVYYQCIQGVPGGMCQTSGGCSMC